MKLSMTVHCVLLLTLASPAQTPVASPTPGQQEPADALPEHAVMPTDPVALIALARKMNGIDQASLAPRHLKFTYEVLDDKGAVKETGTYEEFRVSDKKYKISYISPGFAQTDYSTEAGVFRSGAPEWPSGATALARQSLAPKLPQDKWMNKVNVSSKDQLVGTVQMKCLTLHPQHAPGPEDEVYCLSPSSPVLRIAASSNGQQTIYNRILTFRGAYVAGDVRIVQDGKPFMQVHLDTLESMPQIDESIFVPPPGALPVPRRVLMGFDGISGSPTTPIEPQYPGEAKAHQIQGTVVLQVIIGKDGKVEEAHAISGSPELVKASVDAVRKATYQPFLLGGEPVDVETTVNVTYRMGR